MSTKVYTFCNVYLPASALYIIVSYIVLVLSPAVTDLSNKTLILHDFQGATKKIINFRNIPGLENKILKFHDFPGFPWPVRTLLERII